MNDIEKDKIYIKSKAKIHLFNVIAFFMGMLVFGYYAEIGKVGHAYLYGILSWVFFMVVFWVVLSIDRRLHLYPYVKNNYEDSNHVLHFIKDEMFSYAPLYYSLFTVIWAVIMYVSIFTPFLSGSVVMAEAVLLMVFMFFMVIPVGIGGYIAEREGRKYEFDNDKEWKKARRKGFWWGIILATIIGIIVYLLLHFTAGKE